ncbi:MAG TPA: malonic semialdehyde reductase [Pirellulales bacterium]|nr:malonic semialdehyde reductase [Pirellulales bacterium]
MNQAIDEAARKQIFSEAHTHNFWLDKPVDDELLREVYELAKWGPTSANMSPMRIVFAKSPVAKEMLKGTLSPGNVAKTMAAPVTAIVAMDVRFYEKLPYLFPHGNMKSNFEYLPEQALEYIALRNSSLQGAYLMLAARSLGLDCGPMSGFNNQEVDRLFFAGTPVKSNFLCNLGYGDREKLYPRNPRLSFDEACQIM